MGRLTNLSSDAWNANYEKIRRGADSMSEESLIEKLIDHHVELRELHRSLQTTPSDDSQQLLDSSFGKFLVQLSLSLRWIFRPGHVPTKAENFVIESMSPRHITSGVGPCAQLRAFGLTPDPLSHMIACSSQLWRVSPTIRDVDTLLKGLEKTQLTGGFTYART
jgi:hypothetical protein